ncbi:hypothetical protein HDU86_003348 [Geranomyces michiganensis]|nr:hypothetical protein HDU86_003348 [Geranomyces michiganensis]
MNAVIQAVSSLPNMCEYLQTRCLREATDFPGDEDDLHVTRAMADLTSALNELSAKRSSLAPRNLMDALSASNQSNRRLLCYNQQDAHELLQLVSSTISNEEMDPIVPMSLSNVSEENADLLGVFQAGKSNFRLSRWTKNPLLGLTASAITCRTCNYSSGIRHEPFDILSLAIPVGHGPYPIEQLLREYVAPESIQGFICDRCSLSKTLHCWDGELQLQEERIHAIKDKRKRTPARRAKDRQGDCSTSSSPSTPNGDPLTPKEADLEALDKRLARETKKLDKMKKDREILAHARQFDVNATLPPSIKKIKFASPLSEKRIMIAAAPKSLCLHMQRSVYHPSGATLKNPARINFSEYLDLGPFCTVDSKGTYMGFGVRRNQTLSSFNFWEAGSRPSPASVLSPVREAKTSLADSRDKIPLVPIKVRKANPENATAVSPKTSSTSVREDVDGEHGDDTLTPSPARVANAQSLNGAVDAGHTTASASSPAHSSRARRRKKGGRKGSEGNHRINDGLRAPATDGGEPDSLNGIDPSPQTSATPPDLPTEISVEDDTVNQPTPRHAASANGQRSATPNPHLDIEVEDETVQTPPSQHPSAVKTSSFPRHSPFQHIHPTTQPPYPYIYRLQAVVLHYGTHNSGHFVTLRRVHMPRSPGDPLSASSPKTFSHSGLSDSDGSVWYSISDSRVDLVRDFEAEVIGHGGQHAYMLLYEAVEM